MGKNSEIMLWEKDIPGYNSMYGDEAPSITPFILEGGRGKAAIIICPGGAYRMRAALEGAPLAHWLNTMGISAFVLNYRVAPYRYPYPLYDAKRAIRLVRFHAEQWQINPEQIGIMGFSAGGHLAASAATFFDYGNPDAADPIDRLSSRPALSILGYPVITFGEFHPLGGSQLNLLGENPGKELIDRLSLENSVTKDNPPVFLWHTTEDKSVPVENSLLLAGILSKNKVPFELHIFPNGRHGLGMAPENPEVAVWLDLCTAWLKARGF